MNNKGTKEPRFLQFLAISRSISVRLVKSYLYPFVVQFPKMRHSQKCGFTRSGRFARLAPYVEENAAGRGSAALAAGGMRDFVHQSYTATPGPEREQSLPGGSGVHE